MMHRLSGNRGCTNQLRWLLLLSFPSFLCSIVVRANASIGRCRICARASDHFVSCSWWSAPYASMMAVFSFLPAYLTRSRCLMRNHVLVMLMQESLCTHLLRWGRMISLLIVWGCCWGSRDLRSWCMMIGSGLAEGLTLPISFLYWCCNLIVRNRLIACFLRSPRWLRRCLFVLIAILPAYLVSPRLLMMSCVVIFVAVVFLIMLFCGDTWSARNKGWL